MSGAGVVAPGKKIDSGGKGKKKCKDKDNDKHMCFVGEWDIPTGNIKRRTRKSHSPPIYDDIMLTWELAYVGG